MPGETCVRLDSQRTTGDVLASTNRSQLLPCASLSRVFGDRFTFHVYVWCIYYMSIVHTPICLIFIEDIIL